MHLLSNLLYNKPDTEKPGIVPKSIPFPIYGIPLGLLGLVTKLGGSMLKWGIDCLELKNRKS